MIEGEIERERKRFQKSPHLHGDTGRKLCQAYEAFGHVHTKCTLFMLMLNFGCCMFTLKAMNARRCNMRRSKSLPYHYFILEHGSEPMLLTTTIAALDPLWRSSQLPARQLFWVHASLQRVYELGEFHLLLQELRPDHSSGTSGRALRSLTTDNQLHFVPPLFCFDLQNLFCTVRSPSPVLFISISAKICLTPSRQGFALRLEAMKYNEPSIHVLLLTLLYPVGFCVNTALCGTVV